MTHTKVFEQTFSFLRNNLSVEVFPTFSENRNVNDYVVVETAASSTETTMFSDDFSHVTSYTILISCIGDDMEKANEIYDSVKSLIEQNTLEDFSVTDISSAVDSRQNNQSSYFIKTMSVQLL